MKKIVLLLIIILLMGCDKKDESKPNDLIMNYNDSIVDVYSDLRLYDLIGNNNVILKSKNIKLDTTKVGKHDVIVEYKYLKKKYKDKVYYEVVDNVSPIFIRVSSLYNVKVNQDIYPCDTSIYADNYDKDVSCNIKGNVDLTKAGKYQAKIVLSDSSNNKTEKKITIKVVEENPKTNKVKTNNIKKNKPKKHYLQFDDALRKYKNDNTMVGIDVSRWQGEIDFDAIKEAGVEFVIMRMAVQSDFDKDISLDSFFIRNMKEAKRVGLKVGVYVYTTAINKQLALEHAEFIAQNLNGIKLDFPVAYDWENWNKFMNYQINLYELSECVNVFANTLKHYGYETMLYSSKFYLENIWMNRKELPVWLAHYTSKTNYDGDYILWQLSNTGRVNGIKGDVDIDVFYPNKKEN